MEAVTERGGDGEVLPEGVRPETETHRGGSGTEIERGGGVAAETGREKAREIKAESEGRGPKTGSEGGEREAEKGPTETEGGNAPVHQTLLTARGLIGRFMMAKRRRLRKNRGIC